jgi:hypothetical protein
MVFIRNWRGFDLHFGSVFGVFERIKKPAAFLQRVGLIRSKWPVLIFIPPVRLRLIINARLIIIGRGQLTFGVWYPIFSSHLHPNLF